MILVTEGMGGTLAVDPWVGTIVA